MAWHAPTETYEAYEAELELQLATGSKRTWFDNDDITTAGIITLVPL